MSCGTVAWTRFSSTPRIMPFKENTVASHQYSEGGSNHQKINPPKLSTQDLTITIIYSRLRYHGSHTNGNLGRRTLPHFSTITILAHPSLFRPPLYIPFITPNYASEIFGNSLFCPGTDFREELRFTYMLSLSLLAIDTIPSTCLLFQPSLVLFFSLSFISWS